MVQNKLMEQKAEPKRRGRPRAYDPQAAIARAAETFWKAGYAGTSLDDLVAATGMNRPSLYAAFGDKRDLYLKTLEHYRDEGRALARHALAGEPALRVFLKRFYDKALALYLEGGPRGCYTIGTAATVAAVDDGVRAFLAESMRSTDSFLQARSRRQRRAARLRATPIPPRLPIWRPRPCTRSRSARAPACRERNSMRLRRRRSR